MISLCMIVRNEKARLKDCIAKWRKIKDVSEIIICDQHSDDGTAEIAEKLANIFISTTRKDLADIDRQYTYGFATQGWILAGDADEYPSDELIDIIPKLLRPNKDVFSPEFDVFWFKFKNLVDGIDIKELLGDDWHPRLWRRGASNQQPIMVWPETAHTFPQINSPRQCWIEKGYFIHDRNFEEIKLTHKQRRKVIHPQAQQQEVNFMSKLEELLKRKGKA